MEVNKKTRRQWSAEQKLRIVEEGRQTGHTVSEVCQQYQINLKQFYNWERQAKRGALEGLRQGNRTIKPDDRKQRLEQEVLRLRELELVVQEALDRLEIRRKDEPEIVHDHGSQFISGEWRKFISTNEAQDIATKVAHPQSNGRLERLHRTHREEGLADEPPHSHHHALEVFHKWDDYYNQRGPHSQLNYLCPVDYYRGDPATRLRERVAKFAQARLTRAAYWKEQSQP